MKKVLIRYTATETKGLVEVKQDGKDWSTFAKFNLPLPKDDGLVSANPIRTAISEAFERYSQLGYWCQYQAD